MSKRKTGWSRKKYDQFIKDRNWEATGEDYESTFVIQSFPSTARVTRSRSNTVNRIHNLMSDLSYLVFSLLDFNYDVIDIREHWPLVDLCDSINVSDLGLEKFLDGDDDKVPYILTVTFMLTYRDGSSKAIAVKSTKSLERTLTQRHLEAMRRYFLEKRISFAIITEQDFSKVEGQNIALIMKSLFETADYGFDESNLSYYSDVIVNHVMKFPDVGLVSLLSDIEQMNQMESGSSIFLFKYLIAIRVFSIDLSRKFNLDRLNCSDVKIDYDLWRTKYASDQHVASV